MRQVLRAGALGRPRGMGWGGQRREPQIKNGNLKKKKDERKNRRR